MTLVSFAAVLSAIVVLVAAAASCGLSLSGDSEDTAPSATNSVEGLPQEFSVLSEVWDALENRHLDRDQLDSTEISRGAIQGMLKGLDDPHAVYLTPEQYTMETADFSGQFSGIGAEVTMRNGQVMILSTLPDTPAEDAGLRPGDIILAIDDEPIDDFSLQEAVLKIRGAQGTPVVLRILHRNGGEPVTITIVRDNVKVVSVKFRTLIGGIGHLKISSFTSSTEQEVVKALETFKRRKNQGLILDVRNNPGGLLDSTVRVASHFLQDGLVLYEINGDGTRKDWQVRPGGIGLEIPMVVLMNEFSASGSEVLVGAIKDHGRAPTVGLKTFGKGSVSTLHRLSDGSGIFFTTARWYTPDGSLIEAEGLEPDIVVEFPDGAAGDPQLERAIEVIRAQTKNI